jgi:tRNA(Ile2) C34 agmatinyltransferase TiaS
MVSHEKPKSRLEADAPLCPKCKTRMKVRGR